MNSGIGVLLAVALVFVAGLVLAGTAGAEDEASVSDAIDAAESVESAIEVAADTTIHLVSGAVVGSGIGLLVGSGLTFFYWRRKIG